MHDRYLCLFPKNENRKVFSIPHMSKLEPHQLYLKKQLYENWHCLQYDIAKLYITTLVDKFTILRHRIIK
jgi:hypothetical protein